MLFRRRKRPRGRPRLSAASEDRPALAERTQQPDSFSIISYHSPASLPAATSSTSALDADCSQPAQNNAEPTETGLAFDFPRLFDSGPIEPLSHRSSSLMSDYVDLDGCQIDDILFVDHANIIDSAFDFESGRHNPERADVSPGELFPSPPSANDILDENDACSMEFKSPFPWLCDWTPSVHVTKESWRRLHDNGALTLPGVDRLKKLLRLFFSYFHPSFPVLSEHVFHRIYQSISATKQQLVNDGEDYCFPRMSLAMLKATMFIASAVRLYFLPPPWYPYTSQKAHLMSNIYSLLMTRTRPAKGFTPYAKCLSSIILKQRWVTSLEALEWGSYQNLILLY